MYSPGMLEVRGLWLTRLELDRGRGGEGEAVQLKWNTETTPPHTPPTSAGATMNPEPLLDLVYKTYFLPLSLTLSPFMMCPCCWTPQKISLNVWARAQNWRAKYYCTCCGGNNLKMNNAFWVPWATYVFSTFSPPLYLLRRCGVSPN